MVRIRLLDEFLVEADGVRIGIGGPRPRALLARLAVERDRSVPRDALLEDLWGDSSAEKKTTLRAYMSRLRSTVLGPWLSGGRRGYRLADAPGLWVDLWNLQDVTARGHEPHHDVIRESLNGWRGTPLRGIGEPPFAVEARTRVSAVVDVARFEIARADLDAGRIDRALMTLRTLQAAHPDDDDLLALLHVAQARAATADRASLAIAARAILPKRPDVTTAHDSSSDPPSRALRPAAMSRRRGIPAPIANIVGRRGERAALTAALDVSRLVSLTGAAGVGKTRLAVDWLSSDAVAGEDNIWFVRLDGRRAGKIGDAVAAVIGTQDSSVEGIARELVDRRGILVLDGVETATADAGVLVTAVLSRARGLAVLSTSRRALDVPGESVLRIEPLPLDDARDLFDARLASAPPSPVDSAVVDRLLERLGRLPLAIELAAAHAAIMPVDEVAESMLRGISGAGETEGAPLASALRSSLELLTEEQRDTLRSVAGFAAPFTRDSVTAVCAERPRDVDLDRLVSFSLVSAEDGGARPAFRVSELIRHVALDGGTPTDAWARRHREWFAARADAASVALTSEGSAEVIARLRIEWPDVLAAFESAVRANDRSTAAAIAAGLLWFGVRGGRQREMLALCRRAQAIPGEVPAAREGQLCLVRGFLAYQLGSMQEAGAAIAAARAPVEQSEDAVLRATERAFAAYLLTLGPRSSTDAARALDAALAGVDRLSGAAAAMVMLIGGQVHRASRRASEAIALLDRAGALAVRCGHEWVALMAPVVTAKVHLDRREGVLAVSALIPVVRRSAADGDPVSLLIAASVAAGAAATLGDDATGARIIGAVDAIGRRYGFDPRANEPGDFELYLHRVRQGLTSAEWRAAYALGLRCDVDELVELTESLAGRR